VDYDARFYSPALGRFIQPDTVIPDLTNSQSWNRYSYSYNNPLYYTDPSGHIPEQECGFGYGGCGTEGEITSNSTSAEEALNSVINILSNHIGHDVFYTSFQSGFVVPEIGDDYSPIYMKPPNQIDMINGTTYNFAMPQYEYVSMNAIWWLQVLTIAEDFYQIYGGGRSPGSVNSPQEFGNIAFGVTYEVTYNPPYANSEATTITNVTVTNMSEEAIQVHGFVVNETGYGTGFTNVGLQQQGIGSGQTYTWDVNLPVSGDSTSFRFILWNYIMTEMSNVQFSVTPYEDN